MGSPIYKHDLIFFYKYFELSAIGVSFSTLQEIQKCFKSCATWQKIIGNLFENNCMYLLLYYLKYISNSYYHSKLLLTHTLARRLTCDRTKKHHYIKFFTFSQNFGCGRIWSRRWKSSGNH